MADPSYCHRGVAMFRNQSSEVIYW